MDFKMAAGVDKEDMQVIDVLTRRLLGELAETVWGRNTPFHRHWVLIHHHDATWRVRHAKRPESFTVSLDAVGHMFRVDCAGEPLFTAGLGETQLRRALSVAQHRGPGDLRE